MSGILNEDVEWAVANRFKAMLDELPNTKFNVTQSFALFGATCCGRNNALGLAVIKSTGQLGFTRNQSDSWTLRRFSP
jgi:hypothetical protein